MNCPNCKTEVRRYEVFTDKALDAETDQMLREYIIGLADKCIAEDNFTGPEARLSAFLAEFVYQRSLSICARKH
jgi:hypothetical protein